MIDPFEMKPEVGKWYFQWVGSWLPCGAYDTEAEAVSAAIEFHRRGTTSKHAVMAVGQWTTAVVQDHVGERLMGPAVWKLLAPAKAEVR